MIRTLCRQIFVGTIVAALAGSAMGAQKLHDFSGTWVIAPEATTAVGGGQGNGSGRGAGRPPADPLRQGGALGLGPLASRLVVVQNAKTITIEESRDNATTTLSYALDGSTVTNKMAAGRLAGKPAKYVSNWKDGRLTTAITAPPGGEETEETRLSQIIYLDASGFLVVETTRSGAPNARRAAYRKVR